MVRKVLQIVEAADAGVGRHALDLIEGLVAAGWETHLIFSPLRIGRSFRERLERMSEVTQIAIPIKQSVHPMDLAAVWKIAGYLKTAGPFSLLHGHSSKGGAVGKLAAILAGVPSVYTPNALVTMNPELSRMKSNAYAAMERCLGKAGTMIAVSESERDHAISLGISADRITVVPNGIPDQELPTRDSLRNELGIDPKAKVVGFVGRLFGQKAPEILVRAFARATIHHADAVLAIVGDGPLKKDLVQLADQLDISGQIQWLGERDGQRTMPAFDLFVLSSNYEGMPYVLLEAAHAKLPIVATRVSGTSMVVHEGENGLTTPPGDVDALADAIETLLGDEQLQQRFSQASLARSGEWSSERMVKNTIAVYEDVMRGQRTESRLHIGTRLQ
jgi:glycosyltransferase involved in cell wall biosynthesis